MKEKSGISLGPGASSLILIFVVLALSVLGMLSLMNSRNDLKLSERSARVTEAVAALNVKTEEKRAALDALFTQAALRSGDDEAYLSAVQELLPDNVYLDDRDICWIELDSWEGTDGLRQMDCDLELSPLGETPRAKWARHVLSAVTEDNILALNARAEAKRKALAKILDQAAQTAADDSQYLSSVESALPQDMALLDGVVTFVEINAGTETDYLYQLHGALTILPLDSRQERCKWVQRSVTEVADEEVLALVEQADATLATLTQRIGSVLEEAVSAKWTSIEDADAMFLQNVREQLPKSASMDGREISWMETNGDFGMLCTVEILPLGSNPLVVWTCHSLILVP